MLLWTWKVLKVLNNNSPFQRITRSFFFHFSSDSLSSFTLLPSPFFQNPDLLFEGDWSSLFRAFGGERYHQPHLRLLFETRIANASLHTIIYLGEKRRAESAANIKKTASACVHFWQPVLVPQMKSRGRQKEEEGRTERVGMIEKQRGQKWEGTRGGWCHFNLEIEVIFHFKKT